MSPEASPLPATSFADHTWDRQNHRRQNYASTARATVCFVTEDDMVVVDISGKLIRGEGSPTSETALHLAVYEERPDIQAVIHTHPPHAIAFTLANKSLERLVLPEVVLTVGTIPTVPYVTTGTTELADALRPIIRHRDVLLMDRHGAVTVGTSLHEAFCRLEIIEHSARVILMADNLGGVKELDPAESVHLRSMGLKRYGGPPESVKRADDPMADLPHSSFRPMRPYPAPTAISARTPVDGHLFKPRTSHRPTSTFSTANSGATKKR